MPKDSDAVLVLQEGRAEFIVAKEQFGILREKVGVILEKGSVI
jgi:hypothetical protein